MTADGTSTEGWSRVHKLDGPFYDVVSGSRLEVDVFRSVEFDSVFPQR